MEINEQVQIAEIEGLISRSKIDDGTKNVLLALIRHIHLYQRSLVNQLRQHPQVYIVNPHTNPSLVSGHKEGDICVYKNDQGDVELSQF